MAYSLQWDAPLEDGVYLNLDADRYFRQETRGSSDWVKIHQLGYGWWWQSGYNPDHVEVPNKARNYGSALHAIMLEGIAAYEARFAVEPDPRDFPGLVVTIPQIKAALTEAGYSTAGTSKFTKDDWVGEMLSKLPNVPCWDLILEDFRTEAGLRDVVKSVEDRMLRLMRDVAVSPDREDNIAIRNLLVESEAHPSLAEVSVFSTIDGIRRRWRIDKMLPGADMDLKSVGQWRGRPLKYEIGEVLARNGWDVQRADYHIGRTEAYRLIREGQLFGGTIEQRNYIKEIVEENPTWDWIWLAYGKPEPSGRAPILMPVWDDSWGPTDPATGVVPMGELRQFGQHKLDKAIAFYRRAVDRFGFDQPWANVEPLHFTDPYQENAIVLPHWIQSDAPTEAEAYAPADQEN